MGRVTAAMGVDPERRRPGSGIGEGDPRWRPARRRSRLQGQGPAAVTRSTHYVRASPRGPARGPGAHPARIDPDRAAARAAGSGPDRAAAATAWGLRDPDPAAATRAGFRAAARARRARGGAGAEGRAAADPTD